MKEGYLELAASDGSRRIDLAGGQVTLGRSPDNDVAFPADHAVSRLHAVVKPYGEDWSLLDVGSVNGTYVNGERIHGQHTLREGDVVTFGAQRLVFHGPATSSPYDTSVPDISLPEGARTSAQAGYLDGGEEWSGGPAPAEPRPEPPALIGDGEEWRGSPTVQPSHPSASAAGPLQTPETLRPAPSSPPPAMVTGHRHGRGHVRGVARSVQLRTTEPSDVVLSFRVDQYDAAGNRVQPVGVELRHHRLGQVSDGEEVEVGGRWKDGTLRAERIVNLTTGAQVKGASRRARIIITAIVLVIFVGWAVFLLSVAIQS